MPNKLLLCLEDPYPECGRFYHNNPGVKFYMLYFDF